MPSYHSSYAFRALLLVVLLLATTLVANAWAQQLVVAQGTEPETLDPHATSTTNALNVAFQITERLVTASGKGTVQPLLAVAWTPSADGKTWRFQLRKNVRFTNGEPFDADAVKFSIDRLKKPDPGWGTSVAHHVSQVESVQVVDPFTVDITTREPFPLLPQSLANIGMVPPKYVQQVGNVQFGRRPIGTGPFVFEEWKVGQYIRLKRNEHYGGSRPALAEVEFRGIPDPQTRVSALLANDVQLATQLPVQDVARVKQAACCSVVGTPSLRNMHLLINTLKPGPMQDVRVRQALNYAIDKRAIVDKVLGGFGTVLQGQMLTDVYFGFNPKLRAYPFDPAKAKALLAEAGYSKGLSLELATPRGRYMNDLEVVQLIAAYLEAVGIRVSVQQYEWAPFIGMLSPKKLPELSLFGWAVTPPDADVELGLNMSTHAYSYYRNPKFDELMLRARKLTNDAKRLEIYQQATELLREDASNVWLYQQHDLYGVSKRLQNWLPTPDERLDLSTASLGG